MAVVAEQLGEAAPRVEAGQAQPVDGAVPPDEGGRLGVADEGVVLEELGHAAMITEPGPQATLERPPSRLMAVPVTYDDRPESR